VQAHSTPAPLSQADYYAQVSLKDIESALTEQFPKLVSTKSGDHLSFFYGEPRGSSNPNRILRLRQRHEGGVIKIKLAVSARLIEREVLNKREIEFTFEGDVASLRRDVAEEIQKHLKYEAMK
jgi:hypothetical protein